MRAQRVTKGMREYWDARARDNAAWYVDTSLAFDDPDMARFFEAGETIVADALQGTEPLLPSRHLAVEIGSGLGRLCRALASRFDEVIGVDISADMIERAGALLDRANVSFRLGDGTDLVGVGDGTADLVLSFTVFQHIPSIPVIEHYVHEAGRVLRPGGVFVFQWNNEQGVWWWRVRRVWLGFLQRTGIHRERYLRHTPEFLGTRVPLKRIEHALHHAGLDLVKTKDTGTLYAWAWAQKG